MSRLVHLVFAQALGPSADAASLLANAQRYFKATLEALPAPEAAATDTLRVALKGPRGVSGTFSILRRARTPDDLERARIAEQRGRAAGMAGLAERCTSVWQVEPDLDVDLTATLMLCAII